MVYAFCFARTNLSFLYESLVHGYGIGMRRALDYTERYIAHFNISNNQ